MPKRKPGLLGAERNKKRAEPKYAEAYKLRYQDGKTYRQIADILNYASRGAAFNAVQRGSKYFLDQNCEKVEVARAAAVKRIERLLSDLYDRVGQPTRVVKSDGNKVITSVTVYESGDTDIIREIAKLESSLSKLLGLDAPTKSDVNVDMPLPIVYKEVIDGEPSGTGDETVQGDG